MHALIRFLRGYFSCRRLVKQTDKILVQSFDQMSQICVEREAYLLSLALGKRVLHFGFLDSIFLDKKLADGSLLHTRLGRVASSVYGVDIDSCLLDRYREATNDKENLLWDIADGIIPPELKHGFDLVLFPEVLEHVPNPGVVLSNLRTLCQINGSMLCLTVPNAFDMYGFMAAMHGVEIIHPDHCYTFTPYTLSRLLAVSGFRLLEMQFCNFGSDLAPGLTKAGIVALCEPETI